MYFSRLIAKPIRAWVWERSTLPLSLLIVLHAPKENRCSCSCDVCIAHRKNRKSAFSLSHTINSDVCGIVVCSVSFCHCRCNTVLSVDISSQPCVHSRLNYIYIYIYSEFLNVPKSCSVYIINKSVCFHFCCVVVFSLSHHSIYVYFTSILLLLLFLLLLLIFLLVPSFFFLLVPLLVDVVAYCCCVIEYYSLYELVAQHHTLILSHSLSTFASVRSFLYLLLLLFRRIYEHIRAERVLICIAFLFIFFLQMKTWCPGSGSKRKPYIIEKCVPSAESY